MFGIVYALLAALCNSCIGIFTNYLYRFGMTSSGIAFYRCILALLILASFLVNKNFRTKVLKVTYKELLVYGVLAFFGIFIMYSCEITAVNYIPISLVSFLLYASGINTIILGCVLLKEKFTVKKFIACIFIFSGIMLLFVNNMDLSGSILGVGFALLAGIGYSLFIILAKKFNIQSGLKTLFYMFLFGTIYLIMPTIHNNSISQISTQCILPFLALAIIPTIGGFYFTNKALNVVEASKVQLFEMSEPIFTTILGFFILQQKITITDFCAGLVIMLGLIILEFPKKLKVHKFL